MSVSITVLLQRARLPQTAALQRALEDNGLDVQLDASCSLQAHSGFWLATYRGRGAGFELEASTPDQFLPDYPGVEGEFDAAYSFITGSDMDQACSAWLTAAALTRLAGGVLLDESAGEHVAAEAVMEWAAAVEQEAMR